MRSISEVEPGEELVLDEGEEAVLGPVQLVKRYSATEAMQIHAAAAAAEFLKVITPPVLQYTGRYAGECGKDCWVTTVYDLFRHCSVSQYAQTLSTCVCIRT